MRRYLFLILSVIHVVACSKEVPGQRVDPNSPLGRRELMEQRMEEAVMKPHAPHSLKEELEKDIKPIPVVP